MRRCFARCTKWHPSAWGAVIITGLATADNADGESKHPQSSTAAGPTVYSSDSRGDGGTSDAVAAARDALAATKRRAAAKRGAVDKRSKVPKGKAKGKGKAKAKARPSKRKGGAGKATEVSAPQLTVAPEISAAISECVGAAHMVLRHVTDAVAIKQETC